MEKIILTTFTDPMMGLTYEQEPVYDKLSGHYGDRLVFRYVMSGLVRIVSDFMLPNELSMPPEEGIGSSTRSEIEYALAIGKPVKYLEE